MKNLLFIIGLLFSINSKSQVSTICLDSNNIETLSSYEEQAIIRISITDKDVELYIDMDGSNTYYKSTITKYDLLDKPALIYNIDSENYNVFFNLRSSVNSPIAILLDTSTNCIIFYYSDNSSLMYIGEGVKIIL